MVAGPSLCSLRSRKCSLLQATQKATQNPTHSLLAGGRRAPHRQNGIPIKRPSRRTTCVILRLGAVSCERGISSPSRIRHNRRIRREKVGVGKQATQKATHSPIRVIPQEVARDPRAVFGKGPRQANPPTRHPLSNQATAERAPRRRSGTLA
jgi:hypothetical protein